MIYLGDCLEILPTLPDQSVHAVITDLPYGTTYAAWDSIIPLDKLWTQYKRLIIGNGALIFTSNQPFTTILINSNLEWFRYEWIWDKEHASNFANSKRQPLKQHENIIVFSKGQCPYYPKRVPGKPNHKQGKSTVNASETRLIKDRVGDDLSGLKYPKSILYFPKHSSQCGYHPTQKPVELMCYLIETYTLPGEVVLDNAMGSGTTGVACKQLIRNFIGIEKDENYFKIAKERIDDV
jgi:site-specific DNA-methyltransferase (adenine-specific)